MNPESEAQGSVLILGDWFVDDHWVVGTHRSSTSSRTGRIHLSSLQGVHSATESLCGAGRTASVLHGAGFSIIGVGSCSPYDEAVLLSLLSPQGVPERNPHTLRRWTDVEEGSSAAERPLARFVNLGTEECGTSRAIRLYEKSGDTTELIQRIDWETEASADLRLENLRQVVKREANEIRAVVVKDLGKGLVTRQTIGILTSRLHDVPWFISTKRWHPEWRSALSGVDVQLLLVPEMAARAALGERLDHRSDVKRRLAAWMVRGRTPSKGALAMAQNQLLQWLPPDSGGRVEPQVVVVVPDDRTVLALHRSSDAYLRITPAARRTVPLPMSSVLLGALTARFLQKAGGAFDEKVRGAVDFTDRWRQYEARRISHYQEWNPQQEEKEDLRPIREPIHGERRFNWVQAHAEWEESFNVAERGVVVRGKGEPRLELWRSMTELDGYVCIVRAKRRAVARLVEMVRSFDRDRPAAQDSCLIKAGPGAGKTHLVDCLAKLRGLQVLEFNLTQLFEARDVVECFERIATAQADMPGQQLLVFFDEINTLVGGSHLYGSFLTVLERGVYQVSGRASHLKPALWIFAGTEFDDTDASSKAPDLKSRLTRGVVPLKIPKDDPESGAAELERVYLGALLLKNCFREIEWITEDVLDVFKRMPSGTSIRKLRDFASRFTDVRHRTVSTGCIPWNWVRENAPGLRRKDWAEMWEQRRGGVRTVRLMLNDE